MSFLKFLFADYQSLDESSQSMKVLNMIWYKYGPIVENQIVWSFLTKKQWIILKTTEIAAGGSYD